MGRQLSAIRGGNRLSRRCAQMFAVLTLALVLSGCAQVKPYADFTQARRLIAQATGMEAAYHPDTPLLTEEQLDATFDDGLSLEEALRVALLNNRQLHAEFASIGVAKAGDTVLVSPGTYKERIRLKPGITVKSAGDDAKGKLGLKRAEATIIDGNVKGAKGPGARKTTARKRTTRKTAATTRGGKAIRKPAPKAAPRGARKASKAASKRGAGKR